MIGFTHQPLFQFAVLDHTRSRCTTLHQLYQSNHYRLDFRLLLRYFQQISIILSGQASFMYFLLLALSPKDSLSAQAPSSEVLRRSRTFFHRIHTFDTASTLLPQSTSITASSSDPDVSLINISTITRSSPLSEVFDHAAATYDLVLESRYQMCRIG